MRRPVLAAAVAAVAACSASPAPAAGTPPPAASSATSVTPHPATTTSPACTTGAVLATWSVRRLAEQAITVPAQESDVGSVSSEVAAGAGGVILFGAQAPASIASSLARLAATAPGGVAPFIMTDEEGGAVQRMANLVGSMPSAREMAAMAPARIQGLALQVGRRMKAAGVTMDLAPVLDLDNGSGPGQRDPDGSRSFSLTESVASADGLAFAAGLQAAGVVPVVKHFPGLGQATGNTDDMRASTRPWSSLQAAGLLPFRAAIRGGAAAVMVANASVPGLTGLPASISPAVISGVLRHQLGFSGLVLTDSLSARALSDAGYSVPRASVDALAAGADMVLYHANASQVPRLTSLMARAILSAVASGELPMSRLLDAASHILAAKRISLCR